MKMYQFSKHKSLYNFSFLLVFISLSLSANFNHTHCQLTNNIAKSSKLFSDLSTGGTIFRHILSYVESGRSFLTSSSLTSSSTTSSSSLTSFNSSIVQSSSSSSSSSSVSPTNINLTESLHDKSTITTTTATIQSKEKSTENSESTSQLKVSPVTRTIKATRHQQIKQKQQQPIPTGSSSSNINYQQKRDPLKEELQLRLEFIKLKILHRLGLNKAPSVQTRMNHEAYTQLLELRHLNSDPNKQPRPDYSSSDETDKLFILPAKSTSRSATFNLTFDSDVHHYPVKKVSLFAKMTPHGSWDNDISIILLKGGNNASYESFLGKARPVNDKSKNPFRYNDNVLHDELEWREYDITKLASKEPLHQPENNRMIVIDTDPKKLHSSFLTIEFDYVSGSRKRRRIDCNSAGTTSSCCRESFYVNFTEIGWDHWIIQPPGYYANYCKGKCDISHARYHHTTVVQKYSSIINLCCSPREMSNISLIYVNQSGYLFQKNLANMVVESCDCA